MQDLIQSKVTPQSQMVHGVEYVQYRKEKKRLLKFKGNFIRFW
jgi:hypothetical protein